MSQKVNKAVRKGFVPMGTETYYQFMQRIREEKEKTLKPKPKVKRRTKKDESVVCQNA